MLPFLVENHVLLIFSNITRGKILIFCHGLLLVMTNDQRPQPFHSLLSNIAQVGAATLPHRPIYPILPYLGGYKTVKNQLFTNGSYRAKI